MKMLRLVAPLPVLLAVAFASLPLAGCATNPDTGQPQPDAEEWQLRAAARYGLTAMEQNGMDMHAAGVLHGDDWANYVAGCKTARGLLYEAGAAIHPDEIAKAIAIAKAAVRTGHAAWIMANAASIDQATADDYYAEGAAVDETFDAYAVAHPT